MKKTALLLTTILFCNLTFAQNSSAVKPKILTVEELENQKSKKFETNNLRNFTSEELASMEILINKKDFSNLYEYLKNVKVSPSNYISYLEGKRNLGIIPLYWLMADYYSFQPNAVEATHFWSSVAVITTAQDADLCYDNTVKYAPQKMVKSFPNAQTVISKTPQYINQTMPKVKFFISNLKTRITPEWVCVFGDHYMSKFKDNPTIPRSDWEEKREEVFKKFTKKFGN